SKFEHNDFTDWEIQPSVRLAWTPDDRQTVWGAISRAVRTPARGEHDVRLGVLPPPMAPPFAFTVAGDDDFESEELIAYELGYRVKATETLSVDAAFFYNDYDDLRTIRTFAPIFVPPAELLLPFDNNMDGESYGAEVTAQWQVMPNWRLQGSYTYLNVSLDLKNGSIDTQSESAEDADPSHKATLWSTYSLGSKWELGSGLRYVSSIDAPGPGADSYVELDLRLGWLPTNNLELSLVGRNLLDNHHPEFQPDFILTQPTEVERSVYANAKWRF
ncbi:MAG: TonB-dependent receptor, partial [Gammaproteobacteria bacterium]